MRRPKWFNLALAALYLVLACVAGFISLLFAGVAGDVIGLLPSSSSFSRSVLTLALAIFLATGSLASVYFGLKLLDYAKGYLDRHLAGEPGAWTFGLLSVGSLAAIAALAYLAFFALHFGVDQAVVLLGNPPFLRGVLACLGIVCVVLALLLFVVLIAGLLAYGWRCFLRVPDRWYDLLEATDPSPTSFRGRLARLLNWFPATESEPQPDEAAQTE